MGNKRAEQIISKMVNLSEVTTKWNSFSIPFEDQEKINKMLDTVTLHTVRFMIGEGFTGNESDGQAKERAMRVSEENYLSWARTCYILGLELFGQQKKTEVVAFNIFEASIPFLDYLLGLIIMMLLINKWTWYQAKEAASLGHSIDRIGTEFYNLGYLHCASMNNIRVAPDRHKIELDRYFYRFRIGENYLKSCLEEKFGRKI